MWSKIDTGSLFRHMEVYMINVAQIPFFKDPEDTDSLKTAHFV